MQGSVVKGANATAPYAKTAGKLVVENHLEIAVGVAAVGGSSGNCACYGSRRCSGRCNGDSGRRGCGSRSGHLQSKGGRR